MGGLPPLGLDVVDCKLVVNAREAETARHIYRWYAALKLVCVLPEERDAAGIRSKARFGRQGEANGGKPIGRGALFSCCKTFHRHGPTSAVSPGSSSLKGQWTRPMFRS